MMLSLRFAAAALALALLAACTSSPSGAPTTDPDGPRWLAGDHHIHTRYSVGWDREKDPPEPIIAGDAIYAIPMNAAMARYYGLSWIVLTDHGGPNHSKINYEKAYPELVQSREVVPEVLQFTGLELNTPGADHSSLILPFTPDEAERRRDLEARFDRAEPWPADDSRQSEPLMLEALRVMDAFPDKPLVLANHPSRSATDVGVYGATDPGELRGWNDTAPQVAVGMAGAPGHQARAIAPDGTIQDRERGSYRRSPTLGGFDQMTARLGGFWDSMLGEGRRWWITANSDSHVNWREGGSDFWPGEYSKTWVWADRTYDAVIDGLRHGRTFVSLGDLVTEAYLSARVDGGRKEARMGGTLQVERGADVTVTIAFHDPQAPNANGDNPRVSRVDLIAGDITGPAGDPDLDENPTTRVVQRWGDAEWTDDGHLTSMTWRLTSVQQSTYLRVRGTNGTELEPEPDPKGEDPWTDLWFYTNPVFIEVR